MSEIARVSGHPFVIGEKQRLGDRNVVVSLPDLARFRGYTAVIIDDVIASGQTILKCIETLREKQIDAISCAAVHGIFSDNSDKQLIQKGLKELVVSNSIAYTSTLDLMTSGFKTLDLSDLLLKPVQECLTSL